tara:strand:+ start:203 stop:532 length:330 start_codon:yes stop_codon:yes gene_type:complete
MAIVYKNAKIDLTTTNATTVLTAPAATSCIFKSLMVSNDSSSEDTITLTITDSASAVFSLYKNESVGALSTEELLSGPLVLQENEILKATAATADRLHVVASYMEATNG